MNPLSTYGAIVKSDHHSMKKKKYYFFLEMNNFLTIFQISLNHKIDSNSDVLYKRAPSHFHVPAYMDLNKKINKVTDIFTKVQDPEDHQKIKNHIFKLFKNKKTTNIAYYLNRILTRYQSEKNIQNPPSNGKNLLMKMISVKIEILKKMNKSKKKKKNNPHIIYKMLIMEIISVFIKRKIY
jgi:hypothetical protein